MKALLANLIWAVIANGIAALFLTLGTRHWAR